MCFEEQLIMAELSEFSKSWDLDEYLQSSSYLLSSYLVGLLGNWEKHSGSFPFSISSNRGLDIEALPGFQLPT